MRRLRVWLLGVLVACSVAAWCQDDSGWSVYCNDRKYFGQLTGTGEDSQVEARSLARMLGIGCQIEGSKVSLNGVAIPQAQIASDGIMVPLISTTKALGCRVIIDTDGHRIEVYALRGMVPPDIEKAILACDKITNSLQMDFLYGIVEDAYDQENLKMYHPIATHWVTLADIQKQGGRDAYGYASAEVYSLNGTEAGVQQLEIFIPYGLTPEQTLHTLAHELGHCWQFDNGLVNGDPKYIEGFAEWSAAKVLQRLKLQHEIANMSLNTYKQYSDGYVYFRDLEQSVGFAGVIADMKEKGRPKTK